MWEWFPNGMAAETKNNKIKNEKIEIQEQKKENNKNQNKFIADHISARKPNKGLGVVRAFFLFFFFFFLFPRSLFVACDLPQTPFFYTRVGGEEFIIYLCGAASMSELRLRHNSKRKRSEKKATNTRATTKPTNNK